MAARLEVLEGLLAAVQNWHFVSTLIGAAADRSAAIVALQGVPLFLTKTQAQHVLEMKLSQRTALGRLSLAEERDAIRAELDAVTDDEPSTSGDRFAWAEIPRIEDIPLRFRATG
jgi:DNA gyrase/topoisomerase IV subunit A